MIESFKHRGLRRFFEKGDSSKLAPDMLPRIRLILSTLDAAEVIEGLNLPSFRLHQLKGDLKSFYSVTVRANWRIIFHFENGSAFDVDLIDYH